MRPIRNLRPADAFLQLVNFCSERRDISLERVNHSLGLVVHPDGEFYTVEDVDILQGRYKLIPVASYDGKFIPVSNRDIAMVSSLDGHHLEFIALNTHMFPVFTEGEWDGWDPMKKKDGHEQIYEAILDTLRQYTVGDERVLVVGCGEGDFLDVLSDLGYHSFGIDCNDNNVRTGVAHGRHVQRGRIEDITDEFDIVVEPGVLSAGVVERPYVLSAIPKLASILPREGLLIHAPFSRSLLSSSDLTDHGFDVLQMSFPENLFTYNQPKQFYVARRI